MTSGKRAIFSGIFCFLAVSLRLLAQTPAGTQIENVAFAEYRDDGGYLYSVQSQTVITTVGDGYLLSISKSAERSVYMPSDTVQYHITLQNSGNLAASSASVTDTLSDDLVYYSSEPSATVSGQILSWNLPTIQPGAASQIDLTVVVVPGVLSGESIENTASYRTPEEVMGRASPVTINIGTMPDPVLEKDVDRSSAFTGDTLTYTLRAENAGNDATTHTMLYDHLPEQTEFVSASGNGQYANGLVSWSIGELSPGNRIEETVKAVVKTGIASGTSIINSASLDNSEGISRSAQASTLITEETGHPDLWIEKTSVSAASPGDTVNYRILFGNRGNAAATEILVSDSLSPELEFLDASGVYSYIPAEHRIEWNRSDLNAGARDSVFVNVRIRPATPDGTIAENSASVTSSEDVSVSDIAAVTILSPVLTIGKTAANQAVSAGDQVTYTITYRNSGNGAAREVAIFDTLSADLEYVSATGSSNYDPAKRVVSWDIATLSANMASSGSVELLVRLKSPLPDGKVIGNSASIICYEGFTESASADITVESSPVLSITKSTDNTAYPGDTLLYRIDIANNGNAIATQSTVSDTLPEDIEFISASGAYTYDPARRAVNWNTGDLYPGTDSVLTILTRVKPSLTGINELRNKAWIHTQEGSVRSNITSTTVRSLDLSVSADPDSIFGNGESVTTLTAILRDASGQPLPDGTPIEFSAAHGTFMGNNTVTTLNGIASVQLRSSKIDKQYLPVKVKAQMQDDAGSQVSDSTTVVFFTIVISGIITDTDDNPIDNAVVIIVQGDETIGTDTTGADGQYEIPVYTYGEYTIIIQFLDEFGTVQTITYNIEVTPGAGEMFEIPLTSVLSGRIVDAGTGQPILRSGIPVIITELDTTLFSKQTLTSLYRDTSYTDSSGFWFFSSLDLGTYRVETTPNLAGYYRTGTRSVTLSIPGQYILNANIALRQSTLQSYKTVDRPRAMSGDTITYRIHYGTLEQTLTDTIRIVDQLPEELEWINISPEHASGLTFDGYDPITHELRFYRAGMPAEQIDSILFRVRVRQDLASETATVTNTAIVHTQNDTVSTDDDPRSDASTQLMSPFLAVEKTVNRRMIETGDILGYSVTLENRSNELSLNDLIITDILPPGFRYREGRSVLDGNTIDDPSVHTSNNAQVLTWNIPDTLQTGTSRELKYRVIAGLESRFGGNVNRAFAEGSTADSYRISSNEASAEVILKPGMLHERGFIFGKVFYDLNLNNMHDRDERTVKGVEIITEEGIRVITDEYGKYSIPNVRSGSHVLRINRSTLPEGSSVRVSSSDFLGDNSSRLVKVSPSGIAKANFILGKPGMETAKPEDSVRRSRKLTAKKDTAFLNMELRSLKGSKRIMQYLPWQMDFYMHFEPGKNILAQEDKIMLRQIAKFLKWQDHLSLTINGHTDNIPTRFSPYSDNMALSLARAEAVLDYLKAEGIGEERMNAFGYGETRPKMSNATQAGRKANRRVELIFCQEERLNDASNDLQFRVEIDHSGTLPLKNVRLVSRAPEGFRFDGTMDDGFNVRVFPQKADDHTGIWDLGNWDKAAGYSLHYHAVPDNFASIKTQSTINAYLEFELPDGTKERTGILVNKLHTQVEKVFFKLDLESAMFDIGSAALKPAAKFELDKLAECLVWQDQLKICIEGFTDNSGSAQLNAILSLNRAEAVKSYLSENYDIASERIQTIGYGKDFPVADNVTAEGRERNRRIEIIMKPEFIRETDPVRVISKDRLYYQVEGMTTGHTNNNKNSARKKKR